jgi:hypothetical protein
MPATLHFHWKLPEGALEKPFAEDLVRTIKRETTLKALCGPQDQFGLRSQDAERFSPGGPRSCG